MLMLQTDFKRFWKRIKEEVKILREDASEWITVLYSDQKKLELKVLELEEKVSRLERIQTAKTSAKLREVEILKEI